jgi:hypothetical protein
LHTLQTPRSVLQDGSGLHIPSMTIYRNNELQVPWTTTEIATKDLQTIVRFYITPLVAKTNHLIVNTRRILILLVTSSHFKICNHAYVFTISSSISPFYQRTFHLSLTVLVYYRVFALYLALEEIYLPIRIVLSNNTTLYKNFISQT